MRTKEWALEMALYSKWQNEQLTGLCDALGDAARRQDRGMFFGSIHATLDHILMVDRVLWGFASTGEPIRNFDPKAKLFEDFAALKCERRVFISFHHPRLGRQRTHTGQFPLMQMFNHGTHHRSQITAELHRMGIDYGSTDLPYNPLSQY
jgi:uncharacterized damage-inducible protein DinB